MHDRADGCLRGRAADRDRRGRLRVGPRARPGRGGRGPARLAHAARAPRRGPRRVCRSPTAGAGDPGRPLRGPGRAARRSRASPREVWCCSARSTRRRCGKRSRALLARRRCSSSRAWSTCFSRTSVTTRAPFRCSPTPCARPGSAAKAAPSPLRATGRPAVSGARSPARPSRCTTGLPDGDRAKLRGLMLRLLTLAPDGEPLRSAVPRGAIPGDEAHDHLVERLVQARLVTADADVLDLAHETLARAWPRLRGWLDDDLEGQRILRHLSAATESWHAMGRPDTELYRGDRLTRATGWQTASGADLTAHEADFLARSRAGRGRRCCRGRTGCCRAAPTAPARA